MRQEDILKSYINFFQNQLTKVSNCGEEVSALAFISRLQVTHPLYRHLLKHNVATISEVLSPAQPYIQLEEAMKASSSHSAKSSDSEGSLNLRTRLPNTPRPHGQPAYKRQAFPVLSPSPLQSYRSMLHFTPQRLPINEIFNAIKDQPWVRRPRLIQHNPSLFELEEYCS